MAFKEFVKPARTRNTSPFVSVNKDGTCSISRPVASEYFPGTEAVIFLHDDTNGKFALKPVPKGTTNSYRLRRSPNQTQVSGRAFFTALGVTLPEKARRFDCAWDASLGALVVTPNWA